MFDVLVLALALSMDAFAVSIGLGSKQKSSVNFLSFKAAVYFGLFQGLMPMIGYYGGRGIFSWVETFAHWIAFALLLLIGVKMIYEAFSEGIEEDIAQVTHRVMLILAIATSVDAMAAGFTLTLLDIQPILACLIIGLTTCMFSWLGVSIGNKSGTWLESKAEIFGGVVLILMAFKTLII
jgi:putative Mn2+ efflux pump MntP